MLCSREKIGFDDWVGWTLVLVMFGCPGKDDPSDPATTGETGAPVTTGTGDVSTSGTTATPTGETGTTIEPTTVEPTTVEPTTVEPTTMAETGSSTGEPVAGCECIDPGGDANGSAPANLCPGTNCDLELNCPEDLGTTGGGEACESPMAELECALDLLITGTPGRIFHGFTADQGVSGIGGFILVREARLAVTRTWEYNDLDGEQSDAAVFELREPAHFEGCKVLSDPSAIRSCILDAVTGDALLVCDAGGPYGSI